MPLYEYRCPTHKNVRFTDEEHAATIFAVCPLCNADRPFKRVFSFAFKPMLHDHFNKSVGKPISSMRQFDDELKRKSDEMAQEKVFVTADGEKVIVPGIHTNYKPLEWGDRAAFGATNEGIAESNAIRSKNGDPLLPDIG